MNQFINLKLFTLLTAVIVIFSLNIFSQDLSNPNEKGWQNLVREAGNVGKPSWRPMLVYLAKLHQINTHHAGWPFDYEWEGLGPGYVYGPAFGTWDIVHETEDVLHAFPEHALHQLYNEVKNQEPNGLVPGLIYMRGRPSDRDSIYWNKSTQGHVPIWVIAVQDYINLTKDTSVLKVFFPSLIRQITWFENNRKADGEGFFYNDILLHLWESGVDEGVRFDESGMGKWACIDATSHVYLLYKYAVKWGKYLGMDTTYFAHREKEIGNFIRNDLYDKSSGTFYDIWSMKNPQLRHLDFESMWPLVVGAATKEQAERYINKFLLDTTCFNTKHPIATVGKRDPKFELRMWRGPAWNSMTYWAARACIRYDRKDAAEILLEKALDDSEKQFKRTGTIWEFYNPLGGRPEDVERKPSTPYHMPCRDYLGHNPLIEMARLYSLLKKD